MFFKGRVDEHLRILAQTINGTLRGRQNNTVTVTLNAGETTTEIIDNRFSPDTIPTLTPQTASAASASGVYAVATTGKITIHHDASAATDRRFGLIYVG
jgi:hypothetical protein